MKSMNSPTANMDAMAMYDDTGGVAYLGTSRDLRARIEQHLTRKDSSVTTGVSAVRLHRVQSLTE